MLPPPEHITTEVARALAEDIGAGDVTAGLIAPDTRARGHVLSRQEGVLCGRAWFDEVFRQVDRSITLHWLTGEGETLRANQRLCELSGPARGLLSAERTALNFLQLLSGTATATRRYVKAASGTGATILDTRKTIPGLRLAQKYAVTCGGGHNHRLGLFDAVLIKENHIRAAGSLSAAVSRARELHPRLTVEVETETLDEVAEALTSGADIIMLDNFATGDMHRAVKINAGRAKLEASGGVNLDTIGEIARTGVDFISVGALTKDVDALDLSMRIGD
ncbi:MAG: carboxylating nicotinate-nucleotide diphosphorylase [Gammaproteobacteria bacterium]|jgi:nicotinate-nucleotide pyrophosphorylase (carboxylating)|nr:carboxylating nicotinate-nucleotide diphosphorylase [Gammaproteobacteria bacterium]